MISIKGHIRILREGQEPLDLTEYSPKGGFPELTFKSWDSFVEWAKEAQERAEQGDVQVVV